MRRSQVELLVGACVAVCAAVLLFWDLGGSTLFDWDEARHAQNALEMLRTGDLIVATYGGAPDLWNLKPPLGVWLIASSFEVFGSTEFALRFWAALLGLGTVLVTYRMGIDMRSPFLGACAEGTSKPMAGAVAALVLLSMPFFVGVHGCRTGDHDSPLTFFVTLSMFGFYRAWDRADPRWLVLVGAALGLAVMTKGAVGLLPLPIYGLCVLGSGARLDALLRTRFTALALVAFAIVVGPWVLLRVLQGPEFFVEMAHADLWKRFTEPIEGHVGDGWYYLRRLRENLGEPLFWLFLAALAGSLPQLGKDRAVRVLVCWMVVYVGIFSVAVAKLAWYVLPACPAVGLLLGVQLDRFRERFALPGPLYVAVLAALLVMHAPVVLGKAWSAQVNPHAVAVKSLATEIGRLGTIHVTKRECPQSIYFYLSRSARQVRLHDTVKQALDLVEPGEGILTTRPDVEERLKRQKDLHLLQRAAAAAVYRKAWLP